MSAERCASVQVGAGALGSAARAFALAALASAVGCRAAPQPMEPVRSTAQEVVRRFVDASLAHRFSEAYGLLSEPLRRRYTPERLGRDFELEPSAPARLRKALAASRRGAPEARGQELVFPLAGGGELRLLREPDGLKIGALE